MNTTTLLSATTILTATISSLIPLLLGIGVPALIAGRIPKKLSLSRKRGWLIGHLIFVIITFSGIIGCLVLAILTTSISGGAFIYAAHLFATYFEFLALFGGLGAVSTGTWLAARTEWGLTNHSWVITKWVGMLVAYVLVGPILTIGLWDSLFETFHGTINPLKNPAYLHYREIYFIGYGLQLAFLSFLFFISVLKPWMKRKEA